MKEKKMSKIYVGNLPFSITDSDLNALFAKHGTVTSVNIITDKFSNRPRGFAFVEMETEEAAQKAIAELNGTQLEGRAIVVNAAKPQTERSSRPRSFGERSGNSRPRRW
jgi:RNA recognition motif-containing protein